VLLLVALCELLELAVPGYLSQTTGSNNPSTIQSRRQCPLYPAAPFPKWLKERGIPIENLTLVMKKGSVKFPSFREQIINPESK